MTQNCCCPRVLAALPWHIFATHCSTPAASHPPKAQPAPLLAARAAAMGNLPVKEGATGLNKTEVERMERRLKRLGRGERELAQSDLQMIPELAGNPFLPRIFQLYDQDGDGYITAADMRALLESLTKLSDEEERYKFAFRIFDADEDQFVTDEDLLRWLQATNRRGLSPAQLQQIVANTMAQFDEDGDGQLSYAEFHSMVSSSTERNTAFAF